MHQDDEDIDDRLLTEGELNQGNAHGGRPPTPKRKRRERNELSREEKANDAVSNKRYQVKWEEIELFKGWLQPVKDDPFAARCKACSVNLKSGKSDLERHAKSSKHIKNANSIKGVQSIATAMSMSSSSTQHKKDVKAAEIMIAAAFAEHNVALSVVDHFLPVFQKAAKDSKIIKDVKLGRTKCTAIIQNVIAKVETNEIIENIRKVPFSVMTDGSTDHSNHKSICVMVKYVEPSLGSVRVDLLELVDFDPKDCSAEPQFQAIKKCIEDKGVPMINIIGFGCDNENTMTGELNSVWSRLRNAVPHCMLMGCTCHSAASSASAACKALPDHLDALITKILNYVNGSPKRIATLAEFQEFFNAELHKLLKLCTTRWLCRQNCVGRVLEQWEVLDHFFTVASFEEANFPPNRKKIATEILTEMRNPYNKAYYLFLEYVLNFFNQFNALFQSKKVMIHRLKDEGMQLLKNLCQNYLLPENVEHIMTTKLDDPRLYAPIKEVFLGTKCEDYMKSCASQYQRGFEVVRKKCLDFYVAGATDIKKRLPALNDPVFEEMKFIDPAVALDITSRREIRDLNLLANRYKDLLKLDVDKLAYDWRTMPNAFNESTKKRLKNMEPDALWFEIGAMSTLDEKLRFPELSKLARCVLSLPHSNADCERIFAIVSDIRVRKRNKIGAESMNAICVTRSCFNNKNIDCTGFHVNQNHLDLHNQEMYNHISKAPDTYSHLL